jgi:hypothetical protein
MKEVNGFSMSFDFSKLKKKVDLIEMDGPLLSLYQNEQGDSYLFYWLDADSQYNRWMLIRIQSASLLPYLRHEISLRQVLLHTPDPFVWISDLDNKMVWSHTQCVNLKNIPEDYLPGEESFFEFENQDVLEQQISTDTYELTIPVSDRGFFETFVQKMGWKATQDSLMKKVSQHVAVL